MSHFKDATTPEFPTMDEESDKVPVEHGADSDVPETEHEYISGMKLWLTVTSLTLGCFLMMLDMSIIVTVSLLFALLHSCFHDLWTLMIEPGHSSNYLRLPFTKRRGLVWQRIFIAKVRSHNRFVTSNYWLTEQHCCPTFDWENLFSLQFQGKSIPRLSVIHN